MIVIRNPHAIDVIELTRSEINSLLNEDCSFIAAGVEVRMQRKPDMVYDVRVFEHFESKPSNKIIPYVCWPTDVAPAQLRLTFDGETGKLKKAEVL